MRLTIDSHSHRSCPRKGQKLRAKLTLNANYSPEIQKGKGLIKVNGKPLSLVQPEILRFKVTPTPRTHEHNFPEEDSVQERGRNQAEKFGTDGMERTGHTKQEET